MKSVHVHGLRCYDSIARSEMSASACTRSVPVSQSLMVVYTECGAQQCVHAQMRALCERSLMTDTLRTQTSYTLLFMAALRKLYFCPVSSSSSSSFLSPNLSGRRMDFYHTSDT